MIAVGHSYGGAIITNAALPAGNVVGLVYVAAFAPDEGELLRDIEGDSKDSVLNTALVPLQFPSGQGTETDSRSIRRTSTRPSPPTCRRGRPP